MANELAQLILSVLVLVFGAGVEELAPKFLGVGFPVLLCAVMFFASRRPMASSALFAIAADGRGEKTQVLLVPCLQSANGLPGKEGAVDVNMKDQALHSSLSLLPIAVSVSIITEDGENVNRHFLRFGGNAMRIHDTMPSQKMKLSQKMKK